MKRTIVFAVITVVAIFLTLDLPTATDDAEMRSSEPGTFDQEVFESGRDKDALIEAARHSREYFAAMNSESTIVVAGERVPRDAMVSGIDLFISLVSRYDGAALNRRLLKAFELRKINATGKILFTGYYDDFIFGSRRSSEQYRVPVYARPDDLLSVDLKNYFETNKRIYGKLADGELIPYDRREAIAAGSLSGRARVICYVRAEDLFFMQIEGGGVVDLGGGNVKRLTYAADNGYEYRSIVPQLKERCGPSKEEIKQFLHDNPEEGGSIMNTNPRYVFFRESETGVVGNIGQELVAGRSVAADPDYIPKGILALMKADLPGRSGEAKKIRRFLAVQDAGSAVKENHIDIYFGGGSGAREYAEKFRHYGELFILLPRKR